MEILSYTELQVYIHSQEFADFTVCRLKLV